jgi:hypothetical protein
VTQPKLNRYSKAGYQKPLFFLLSNQALINQLTKRKPFFSLLAVHFEFFIFHFPKPFFFLSTANFQR